MSSQERVKRTYTYLRDAGAKSLTARRARLASGVGHLPLQRANRLALDWRNAPWLSQRIGQVSA